MNDFIYYACFELVLEINHQLNLDRGGRKRRFVTDDGRNLTTATEVANAVVRGEFKLGSELFKCKKNI